MSGGIQLPTLGRHLLSSDHKRSLCSTKYVQRFIYPALLAGIPVAHALTMLKLLGSFALAKLLGFGLVGAIVIYALLSLLT